MSSSKIAAYARLPPILRYFGGIVTINKKVSASRTYKRTRNAGAALKAEASIDLRLATIQKGSASRKI